MKTAVHQYEDKLLEFAYGELSAHEAAAVDAHVRGCARCTEALTQIRSVRTAMSQLPPVPAPDAGLESLLAYAEQTAKRNAAGEKKNVWWRRYLMPLASAAALLVVGVVAWRASQEFNPDPAMVALQMEKERDQKATPAKVAAPTPVAAAEPAPVDAPKQAEAKRDAKEQVEQPTELAAADSNERRKAAGPQAGEGGGRADGFGNKAFDDLSGSAAAPLSQAKRESKPKAKAAPSKLGKADFAPSADESLAQDYSNAAQRGAYKTAPPKPEPLPAKDALAARPPPQEQPEPSKNQGAPGTQGAWGLSTGTSGRGTGSGGLLGGAVATATPDTAKQEAPETKAANPKKKSAKVSTETVREEEQAFAQAAPPPPAPVVAAPQASAPSPAPSSAPMGKGSLGLKGLSSSSSTRSAYGDEDQAMAESADKLGLDREAQYQQRNQAELRQKNLEAARVASNRNDRVTEVKLALAVLNAGAQGSERVEALKRVCDAYEAMGEFDRAQPYCDTLVREFPTSAAAQSVASRRNRVEKAPAAKRAAQPADALEAAPQKEPARVEPASKPAEAY